MINSSAEEEEEEEEVVAGAGRTAPRAPPRRTSQSRLHNFSFPTLSWGAQRLFRCSISAAAEPANGPATYHDPPRAPPPTARARKEAEDEEASSSAVAAAAARPWNLRTRRAACSAPLPPVEAGGRNRNSSLSPSPSPLQVEKNNGALKSVRLRSEDAAEEKEERRKFSVSLARGEIEEDFLLFKGSKPSRRPKKLPRVVQRQLDSLFPGLWLAEVTPDTYKITE